MYEVETACADLHRAAHDDAGRRGRKIIGDAPQSCVRQKVSRRLKCDLQEGGAAALDAQPAACPVAPLEQACKVSPFSARLK